MMNQRNKKKQEWSSQEIKLLQDLYPEYTSKKWKMISEVFKSKGYNRSQIDCREKWINFVDPSVNKKEWQEWELRRMYQIHSKMGTRWCLVEKQIGRTQNKIKNRFYSTLRNFIRFLLNYFDSGRSCLNYQITKLSPKFLNQIYNSQNSFSYLNGEVKNAIFYMNFKIDKKILTQRVRENRSLYTKLHQFIVNNFQSLNNQVNDLTPPMSSYSVSLMKRHFEELSEQKVVDSQEVVDSQRREQRECQQYQEEGKEYMDLPRTRQSLQNIYLNQSYYYQQSSPMFYYILSYL